MNFILFLGVAVMSVASILAKPCMRAAIDIGSGGVKLRVAEVDAVFGKIVRIVDEKQIPVIFYEDLRHQKLGQEIMDRGVHAIQAVIASVRSHDVDGITIVGTSVFRNAVNGRKYAERIHAETGIKVHIVDQELEGGLGFLAAAAHSTCGPQDLIVWDIGGKTVQWSSKKANGCFHIAMNENGSGYFRDYIITSIQGRRLEQFRTPNPISLQEANLASAHAVLLADQLDPIIQSKLQTPGVQVIGVGSVFGRGILPWLGNPHVTIQDLDRVVEGLIGLSDEALGGGDFACIEMSNALLVQGFMHHLKLGSIDILDVNLADGAMVYEPFWE